MIRLWLALLLGVCMMAGSGQAATVLLNSAGGQCGWVVSLPEVDGAVLVSADGSTVTEVMLHHNPYAGTATERARVLLPQHTIVQAYYLYPGTGNYLLAVRAADAAGREAWSYHDLLTGETVITGMPPAFSPVIENLAIDENAARRKAAALLAQPVKMLAGFPAHALFRTTHATAAISLLEYWGLRPESEPAPVFAGTLASFAARCLCDDARKPMVWELGRGIQGFAGYRRQSLTVEETAGTGFTDYCWQIDNRFPVLLTLTYGAENRDLQWRSYRLNARSGVGIGYTTGGTQYAVIAGNKPGELTLLRWDDTPKLLLTVRHEEREPDGKLRTVRLATTGESAVLPAAVRAETAPAVFDTQVAAIAAAREIRYFYDATCRDCLRTDALLQRLLAADSTIVLRKYNLKDPENVALLLRQYRAYRIPAQEWQGTLILFAGSRCFRGYDEIVSGLVPALNADTLAIPPPVPTVGADTTLPREAFAGFSTASIALAGLADGINPCAFGVLLFFFTCLRTFGKERRDMLTVGLAFAAGVFVAYLLIGIGALRALFHLTAITWLARWLYPLMAVLSLIMAVLSLLDWHRVRHGDTQGMLLRLPNSLQTRMHTLIRRQLGTRIMATTAFAIGLAISVLELACTGQIYLPVLICIAGDPALRLHALWWLLLYVAMFILPLIVLFAFVYWGAPAVSLSIISRRLAGYAKLALSLVFAVLTVYLLHISAQIF